MSSRREVILNNAIDTVANFLYYARKEDEDLPVGSIEQAIAAGEVTVDEIVSVFRRALEGEL